MAFIKLFGSILDSTVWQEDLATKVVWITMMAMADRDGLVEASVPGLAKRAGVGLDECETALGKFRSPDPYSRTRDFEGRRIEDLEGGGGWRLLNYQKYRSKMSPEERKAYKRQKQAEYRQRSKWPKNSERNGVVPHEWQDQTGELGEH